MTENTQSTETDGDESRGRGPIGTVVGATLGPFGAAVGTVVDDTRFALKLSVGGTGSGGGGVDRVESTTIEIEDADEACTDVGTDGAAGGTTGDAGESGLDQ
jgi:hypothetical protein